MKKIFELRQRSLAKWQISRPQKDGIANLVGDIINGKSRSMREILD